MSTSGSARPVDRLLLALGGVLWVATLCGFGEDLDWRLGLLAHLRPHLAAASLLLAVVAAARPTTRRASLAFGAAAAVNAAVLAPLFRGATTPPSTGAPRLRVALANVLSSNDDRARAVAVLRGLDADLLVLLEVTPEWMPALRELEGDYPHLHAVPRPDNFGVALLSRLPLAEVGTRTWGGTGAPSVRARVEVGGTLLTVVGIHPFPPLGASGTELRDEQLAAVGAALATEEDPVVLLGDLNATPWSAPLRRLAATTGLVDSTRGFGLQPTWPAALGPLGLPLDQCLCSAQVAVVERAVGPALGSDHRPLVVDLALLPRR